MLQVAYTDQLDDFNLSRLMSDILMLDITLSPECPLFFSLAKVDSPTLELSIFDGG